jgi:ABC-type amino acid transport substrate-binding protein
MTPWWQRLLLLLFVCTSVSIASVLAQPDGNRVYTKDNPLVFEDSWALWPYAFLNEEGEPDGFNVELIEMLMKELDIPYVIKLKSHPEVFADLKAHQCDLTLSLAAGFDNMPALLGRNAITLFTQSVVTPKSKPITIKNFRDLSKPGVKVIVRNSSICYHLMTDYGWADNFEVQRDLREALRQVNDQQEGLVVWNTLGLKWLINHYHFDDVELTPVNMPHGEYKFMANDQHLLDILDEAYSRLYTADKLQPLEDKWFYPERFETSTPGWLWYLTVFAFLLLAAAIAMIVISRMKDLRAIKANNRLNRRLALIIETCQVRIWTYHVETKEFAWHNEKGQVSCTYSTEEFSERYTEYDFERLQEALDRLIHQKKDAHGHEEEELTLELRAKDVEGGDDSFHDFVVVLTVLSRDHHGKPTVIIGTKKDVTESRQQRRRNAERSLRYWSMFYSPDAAVVFFGKDGCIVNASVKACEMYECEVDEKVNEHVHLNDWFGTNFTDLNEADGYHSSQQRGLRRIEYKMNTVQNDRGAFLGVFAFCRYIAAVLFLFTFALQASAQALTERYNSQRPVVVVCDRENLPYEFINEAGEPAGCHIDIVKAVLGELHLPCKFVMMEKSVGQLNFEESDADLIMADGRHYRRMPFYVSDNVINFMNVEGDSIAEIHFIGKDRQLIERMSDQFARLQQRGTIANIKDRWMHPERVQSDDTPAALCIFVALLVLAVILYLLSLVLRLHARRINSKSDELNKIMYTALHMGNYDVMQYDISRNRITNQYGSVLPEDGYTLEDYIQRIDPSQRAEFSQKMRNLMEGKSRHFELNKRWNHGTEEEPEYLYFQGHAICELNKKGCPAYIINAVNDVTQETKEQLAARDLVHCYRVLLSNPFVAMAFYDKKGSVIDQNDAMRQLGGVKDSKHIQPLYNVKGEIACFFVTKPVAKSDHSLFI